MNQSLQNAGLRGRSPPNFMERGEMECSQSVIETFSIPALITVKFWQYLK